MRVTSKPWQGIQASFQSALGKVSQNKMFISNIKNRIWDNFERNDTIK